MKHAGVAVLSAFIPLRVQATATQAEPPIDRLYVLDIVGASPERDWPLPSGGARFKPEHPVNKLNADYDLFGGGSVTIISTPGHTPGPAFQRGVP